MTVNLADGSKIHLFNPFSESKGKSPWQGFLSLDLDNTNGKDGPETISINDLRDGEYLFSVLDYSNQGDSDTRGISDSNVMVRLLEGDRESQTFFPPFEKDKNFGFVWNVFQFKIIDKEISLNIKNVISSDPNDIWIFSNFSNLYSDPLGIEKPLEWGDELSLQVTEIKNEGTPKGVPKEAKILKVFMPNFEEISKEGIWIFEEGKAQGFEIINQENVKTSLDVIFIIDLTGSMNEELQGVTKSISDFVRFLNTQGLMVRIGILPYDDGVPAIANRLPDNTWLQLTDSKEKYVQDYLNLLDSTNGGTEVPFESIRFAAENSDWNEYSEKILVLVTDEFQEEYPRENCTYISIISYLKEKEIIVHGIFSSGNSEYKSYERDYSNWNDPREIVIETKGLVEYTDANGVILLDKTQMVSYSSLSKYIIFIGESTEEDPEIEIFIQTKDKSQGQWKNFSSEK